MFTHCSLLLGNDYIKQVDKNGEVCVLGRREDNDDKLTSRLNNGMIDALAAAEDKELWINSFGTNGKQPLSDERKKEYWDAY